MGKVIKNIFKEKLTSGEKQIGAWNTICNGSVSEILGFAGFDWVVVDTEHAASDPIAALEQLQALGGTDASVIVRPAKNDTVLIKRFLDIGFQTLIIPFVETADEAQQAVQAMRYPPHGIRGVAGTTRATRYGTIAEYAKKAETELCLIVQLESRESLKNIEDIAAVDGVDSLFIGPGDLAASLGYLGNPSHPEVKKVIKDTIVKIKALGKPVGIFSVDLDYAEECFKEGVDFITVALDAHLLMQKSKEIISRFKN